MSYFLVTRAKPERGCEAPLGPSTVQYSLACMQISCFSSITVLYTCLHLAHRLSRSPLSHVLRHRHGLSSP